MESVYIDLFDDGLCDWSSGPESSFERLKNHLRLVALLSILFDRKIIAPEQWAISSAACIDVLGEIAAGHRVYASGREAQGLPKLPSPLQFIAFPRSAPFEQVNTAERVLATAFCERLGGRRIRTSKAIDTLSGGAPEARAAVAELMRDSLSKPLGSAFTDGFEAKLGELLDDPGRAARLAALFRHNEHGAPVRRMTYDGYGDHLAAYYHAVKRRYPLVEEATDEQREAYTDFFDIVETEKIKPNEYATLLEAIRHRRPDAVASIEHVFRHGMHVAMSEITGAEGSTLTFGEYERLRGGAFEEGLTMSAVGREGLPGAQSPARWEAEAYDLVRRAAPRLDGGTALWRDEWRRLFELVGSVEFHALRGKVYAEVQALQTAGKRIDEVQALDDLLGFVSDRLDAFEFERKPEGRYEVREKRRYAFVDGIGGAMAIGGVAAPLAMAGTTGLVIGGIVTTAGGLLVMGKAVIQSGAVNEITGKLRQLRRRTRH